MISLLTAVPFLLWSASALAQWNVIYENDGNVTYMDDDSLRIVEILDFGRTRQLTMTNIQEILSEKIENSRLIVFDNLKHNLLVGKNNVEIVDILKKFYKKR